MVRSNKLSKLMLEDRRAFPLVQGFVKSLDAWIPFAPAYFLRRPYVHYHRLITQILCVFNL